MSAGYLRGCAKKEKFSTKDQAKTVKATMCVVHGITPDRLTVYRCIQCLAYHVGGTSRSFVTRNRRHGKRPNKRLRGRT